MAFSICLLSIYSRFKQQIPKLSRFKFQAQNWVQYGPLLSLYHPNFLKRLPAIMSPNVSLLSQCISFSKVKCEANDKIPSVILRKVCFPPLICFHVFFLVLLFLTLHLGDISLISSRERRLSRRWAWSKGASFWI